MGLQRRNNSHNNLIGRDALDAHPTTAVTGLETRLENIESVNTSQQSTINDLLINRVIEGGTNWGGSGGVVYDGGVW